MRALVTGATGFVGQRLLERLERPVVLSRHVDRARSALARFNADVRPWSPEQPPAPDVFAGVDTIFHLAGEPVAEGRWTAAKRVRLRESRVAGTRNLVAGLATAAPRPAVLVSASAVGYYGTRGDDVLDETAGPQNDFLAEICTSWEAEAQKAEAQGVRVVLARLGIVIGPGGALAKMLTPFKLGLGSALGSGQQWMPWVHRDDVVALLLFAAENNSVRGPVNVVSPNPATNRDFTRTLGRALGRPTFLPPLPQFMMYAIFGGFAEVLLSSQRAVPQAALAAGYQFQFPVLEPALRDAVKR